MDPALTSIIEGLGTVHQKLAMILYWVVNLCNIDQSKYYIIGSYAIREHRVISDLDCIMNPSEFDKLPRHIGIFEEYNNQSRWFLDLTSEYQRIDPSVNDFSIEIFRKSETEGYPDEKYSLQTMDRNGDIIIDEYGHQFMSLKVLLRWKTQMNRAKDRNDIKIIESLL